MNPRKTLIDIHRDLPDEIRSLSAALDQMFRDIEVLDHVRTGTDAENFIRQIAFAALEIGIDAGMAKAKQLYGNNDTAPK